MIERFAADSVAYGMTTILSRASLLVALLVLPFLLTPRDYGALSMIVTVAALAAVVLPLEITQALGRLYPGASAARKKALAGTAWTFLVAMSLVFLVAGQALAAPLCRLVLGDLAYLTVFRIALLLMMFNAVFVFLQMQCRWEFRTAEYVLISLVFSFLGLALSIGLGLLLDPPLFGVVLGQVLGAGIAAALGAAGLSRSLPLRFDKDRLREMLGYSLPLVPATLAVSVSIYASRLVLKGVSTLDDVGLYTLAAQIAGIAALGIVGVQAALTPLVMANHHKPETPGQIARLFEGFYGSAIVVCLLFGLFAPDLIFLVGYPGYDRAGPLVLLLAPGLLLMQFHVFSPGFAIAKRTVVQMWVSIASAVAAVALNLLLIGMAGIYGAAIATLVAGVFFLGLWFWFSNPSYPIPVRWHAVAGASAGAVLIGAGAASMEYPGFVAGMLIKAALVAAAAGMVWLLGLVPLRATFAALRAVPLLGSIRR